MVPEPTLRGKIQGSVVQESQHRDAKICYKEDGTRTNLNLSTIQGPIFPQQVCCRADVLSYNEELVPAYLWFHGPCTVMSASATRIGRYLNPSQPVRFRVLWSRDPAQGFSLLQGRRLLGPTLRGKIQGSVVQKSLA